ncbi:MAG: sodium-dependent transporter [Gammaproteobacteria bacterium]|nr:sodium-dependent transporter [Gammaproteobacteria bacterium]
MPGLSRRSRKSAAAPVAHSADIAGSVGSKRWSDTFTFVLALTGAAITFKTLWQFPYLVSENGGGAFILIYLLLAFLVGAPLLIAEVMLGRRAHASPITALADLGRGARGGRHWALLGWLTVLGGFIVFSYLSVVAGWAIGYFVRTVFGVMTGLTADGIASVFTGFVRDPEKQIFWYSLFITTTLTITAGGLRRRLEPTIRVLVPLLLVALLTLAGYALSVGNFRDAATFLFTPDFAKLSPVAWLAALAQVFFSLGLGTGMAMMYGAYLDREASIARAALTVVGLDALIAVFGSVIVFAVLLGGGVAPTSGPSLVFQALPLAFDHLPYGRWFGSLFFALIVMIALATAIALIEPVIAWMTERFGIARRRAAIVVGLCAWLLGLVSLFSFNYWAFSFKFFGMEKQIGAFDVLQILTAQGMLPLAGLALALFAGWFLPVDNARADLALRSSCAFDAWLWLLRLVVPPLLLLLFVSLSIIYA